MNLNRRDFLKISAGAGGSLLIGVNLSACNDVNNGSYLTNNNIFDPNIWLKILPDNQVIITIAKMEMGQGVMTALPMLVAEELEADWKCVRVEQASLNPEYGFQSTGGSNSIRKSWETLRYAGATVREILRLAAAKLWKVPLEECIAKSSMVTHTLTGKHLEYGQLTAIAASLPIPDNVSLKSHKDFRIIGKSIDRIDSPSTIDGSATYGIDVKLPGLLMATIKHCPVFGGKLNKYDASKAEKITGVKKVVPLNDAVAVIADNFWTAKKGLDALKIEWEYESNNKKNTSSLYKTLKFYLSQNGKVARNDGDASSELSINNTIINAEYELPFQAHATMEPMNCTAHIHNGICEIWVPTQTPSDAQNTAFEYAFSNIGTLWRKLKRHLANGRLESVQIHSTLIGGGFGRRLYSDYVSEAVQIAKTVQAPVKLIWSREEDIQHDFYNPLTVHRLRATLGSNNMPIAWHHRLVGPDVRTNGSRTLPYDIPNVLVDYTRVDLDIPVGPWRSVGHSYNAFVTESFIDELAYQARYDPLTYRLKLLTNDPRLYTTLELAAEKANWGKPLPDGHYQGVAVHASFGSYAAQIAEISVGKNNNVKVHRIICAFDCGIVVNPDTVRAQIEGGIIFGLTATLKSEISINDGRVEQSNFNDFPLLSMDETPDIEIHIVKSAESPGGVGEPGVPPIAPAIANAIFAATSVRIRKLPIYPNDIKRA